MVATPMLSQRVAPWLFTPSGVITSSSRIMPSMYIGTARRISQCSGMLATSHIAANATTMLPNWASTRIQLPSLALYSNTRPTSMKPPSAASSTGSSCCMKRCLSCLAFISVVFRNGLFAHLLQGLGHLAEQIIIHHLARDRRGGGTAVAAVLGEHRQRDAGLVGGSEGDEPGVVAVVFGDSLFIVLFALLDGDHLRRAGLARHAVGDTIARTRCSTTGFGDRLHGALHQFQVVGVDLQVEQLPGLDRHRVALDWPDLLHQVRLEGHAVVGQRRGGERQLHRSDQIVALADTRRDGVAGEPELVVTLGLPFGGRRQAGGLAFHVDAGLPPEAEARQIIVHLVDA